MLVRKDFVTALVSVLVAIPVTLFFIVVAFLDLNNQLNIGPKDSDGFTPFDHGVFGTGVKVLLAAIVMYCLYFIFFAINHTNMAQNTISNYLYSCYTRHRMGGTI